MINTFNSGFTLCCGINTSKYFTGFSSPTIGDRFDSPVRVIPQLAGEVQGLETLSELGRDLLSVRDD